MTEKSSEKRIPPVQKSLIVPWPVEAAFRRFTEEIGTWWPIATHSLGGTEAASYAFEGRASGKLYEVRQDGTRTQWGSVVVWEPPSRVVFTWHPGRTPETAQEVEVRFTPAVD